MALATCGRGFTAGELGDTGTVRVRTTLVAVVALVALGSIAIAARATAPDAGALADAAAASAAPERIDGPASASVLARRLSPTLPGNPGGVPLPAEARPVDTSRPDRVVGTGTPASCTSQAVVDAVALGGIITFDCGPDPVTIVMTATAKVVNTSPVVVIDGGGKVTLSGAGQRRILYMNTCDPAQIWTTSHCQNQDHPQLTIQGMHFTEGNSTGDLYEGGGGGAVFVRGGRVKVIESRFTANHCDPTGPDLGGAALRILSQYQGLPVIVSTSTFGGSPSQANSCSNGAAISSIGVSWQVFNSVFINNKAIGIGSNPGRPGTPGGGNGGAIYLDGNLFTLDLAGSIMSENLANEGGGAIFFVSNDRTGELRISQSVLERNPNLGYHTAGFPGIYFLGRGAPQVTDSTIR